MTQSHELKELVIDRQVSNDINDSNLPSENELTTWLSSVLKSQNDMGKEITLRFVDEEESKALNSQYRQKHKPTNVLSFPFEAPPGINLPFLGDLVICKPVIEQEAVNQNKPLLHHYAHMVIHGCLHLYGYDHIDNHEAETMEALEIELLQHLNIDDPYQEF
jgi:probable rRNA maturation factor